MKRNALKLPTQLLCNRRLAVLLLTLCVSSCQSIPPAELPLVVQAKPSVDPRTTAAQGNVKHSGDVAAPSRNDYAVAQVNYEVPVNADEAIIVTDGSSAEPIDSGVPVGQAVEKFPHMPVEPQHYQGDPIPIVNASPWAPPGIAGPWPHDEYLEDGGDAYVQVNVGPNGEVRGLEMEDTVAIYDTVDGRTLIKPSNRVCLYAPRFAAVRHVASVIENQQNDQLVGINQPVMPHQGLEDSIPTTAIQPIRPQGGIATKQPSIEQTNEVGIPAISLQPIRGIENGFATYENLLIMQRGLFEESEKSRLLEGIDAAIVWTHEAAVQVVLDGRKAVDVTGDQRAQATFRYDEPDSPCLRVIKIASKKNAKPGEIVDFTIRFDNLGDVTIKRVVLIDNLTTRLEYVPTTAQSSLRADFTTEVNDGDSLVLRWDFADPLPPGKGGLVRFNCKVR